MAWKKDWTRNVDQILHVVKEENEAFLCAF